MPACPYHLSQPRLERDRLRVAQSRPTMRVTNFADFGLRALVLLAERNPEILRASVIADHFGVSRHHMAKVLHALVTAGYAEGIRGAHGGVRLARNPKDIRIGDVIRAP